jgi:hypothetical protein
MNILFVDIDHTLSHAHWRDEMIDEAYRNWDWNNYHGASINDDVVPEIAALIDAFVRDDWEIVALTTREEQWRALTNSWLLKHNVPVDTLLMRPNGDRRSSGDSKLALFNDYMLRLGLKVDNVIVIDDHDGPVGVFKNANVTVLQAYVKRKTDERTGQLYERIQINEKRKP